MTSRVRSLVLILFVAITSIAILYGCFDKKDFDKLSSTYADLNITQIEQQSESVDGLLKELETLESPLKNYIDKHPDSRNNQAVNKWLSEIESKREEWETFKNTSLSKVESIKVINLNDCCTSLNKIDDLSEISFDNSTKTKFYKKALQDKVTYVTDTAASLYSDLILKKKNEVVTNIESKAKADAKKSHELSNILIDKELSSEENTSNSALTINKVYSIQYKKQGFFELGSNGWMKVRSWATISYSNPCEEPQISYGSQILSDDKQ